MRTVHRSCLSPVLYFPGSALRLGQYEDSTQIMFIPCVIFSRERTPARPVLGQYTDHVYPLCYIFQGVHSG